MRDSAPAWRFVQTVWRQAVARPMSAVAEVVGLFVVVVTWGRPYPPWAVTTLKVCLVIILVDTWWWAGGIRRRRGDRGPQAMTHGSASDSDRYVPRSRRPLASSCRLAPLTDARDREPSRPNVPTSASQPRSGLGL